MGNSGTGALALPAPGTKVGAREGTLKQLNAARVLLSRVRRATDRAVVVFDVDDTLFRTAHRSLRILTEWTREAENRAYAPALADVPLEAVGYGIQEALVRLGVPERDWGLALAYWRDRFFTSHYVQFDRPYAGAVAYVQAVLDGGGRVVYLTGRHVGMEPGTVQALVAHGFPWAPEDGLTTLVLKPDPAMDDARYKAEQFARLAAEGPILGAFDNEPGNCNLFHELCPEAMAVFIDHPHSPNAPALAPRVYRIAAFPALEA